jgi:peptidoglycan/xylan/chitin deacetylase (PgdA/CDA1 family)
VILTLSLLGIPINYAENDKIIEKRKIKGNLQFTSISIENSSFLELDSEIHRNKTHSDMGRAVIVMFDRGYQNQFTYAKPILDKYGFKASFFIICSLIDKEDNSKTLKNDTRHSYINAMSVDQIMQLHNEGHDIEAHGMEHKNLNGLGQEVLEDEISKSRDCLKDNGLNPTYFQIPFNRGADNATVLKAVSKYFDFALSGHSTLMFLNCDGWINYGFKTRSYKYQYDCNPYTTEGIPTRTNKYAIKEWSHDRFHSKLNNEHSLLDPHGKEINDMLLNEFVRIVESQNQYNAKAGKIVAVPIIGYHKIDNSSTYDTSIELFDRELKYLHDNGFTVLKLTDLGFDEESNKFYIKQSE